MKKDITILKVEDLAVAILPRTEEEEDHDYFWDAWLINLKNEPIASVLVNSTGYGILDGEERKTSSLRYFWDQVEPQSAIKIEPIQKDLLCLANEYWISFSYQDYLFDKKYVFVAGSIDEINFTEIPLLHRKGVMIR